MASNTGSPNAVFTTLSGPDPQQQGFSDLVMTSPHA
jgi:hypothetical protein